jgi:anthranilate synthase component 1
MTAEYHISSVATGPPSRPGRSTAPPTLTMSADVLTPVSAYLSLRPHSSASFLFESVEGGEQIARYSFIGIDPRMLIESHKGVVTVTRGGRTVAAVGDIFTVIREILGVSLPPVAAGPSHFSGGLVGYIGYDEVRAIENIPCSVPDPTDAPDSMLGMFRTTVVFDHRDHTITIVGEPKDDTLTGGREEGRPLDLREVRDILRRPVTTGSPFGTGPGADSSPSAPQDFVETVESALGHIRAGDIFQVVLSCLNTLPYSGDPLAVYRTLRMINPSPYHYFLDFGGVRLIGSSPEMLIRKRGSRVEHVPIAGTRPRGPTPAADTAAAASLAADEKERAEHTMLVDLGRNDLSKICLTGTVSTDRFMDVERYSHVMHLVSRVSGTCRPGTDGVDALRAVFPAGTVSGAPKIRAMEIIDELENSRRGFYAGAVGYFGQGGNLDFCIAIRTIMAFRGHLHLRAGAGIVAGSDPRREREEIAGKMRVLYDAVAAAGSIDR